MSCGLPLTGEESKGLGHITAALKDDEVCYDVRVGHKRVAILVLESTARFPSGEKVSGEKAQGINPDREARENPRIMTRGWVSSTRFRLNLSNGFLAMKQQLSFRSVVE